MTKLAPAKAQMILSANKYLKSSTENAMERMKSNRFISNANWGIVKEYLPKESQFIAEEIEDLDIVTESKELNSHTVGVEQSTHVHDSLLSGVPPIKVASHMYWDTQV